MPGNSCVASSLPKLHLRHDAIQQCFVNVLHSNAWQSACCAVNFVSRLLATADDSQRVGPPTKRQRRARELGVRLLSLTAHNLNATCVCDGRIDIHIRQCPPASRQTRATARSSGTGSGARRPVVPHTASKWPWQLQVRSASCRRSRRRRRSSTRNWMNWAGPSAVSQCQNGHSSLFCAMPPNHDAANSFFYCPILLHAAGPLASEPLSDILADSRSPADWREGW